MSGILGTFWSENWPKSVKNFHCGRKIRGLKMRFWVCISYTNRLKSAPKAPKFLGNFGLLIRTPPCFGTIWNKGGFLIENTTDLVYNFGKRG